MSAATYVTAQILRALPRARIGRAVGRLADHPWSPSIARAIVGVYARAYDVALDEADTQGGWASFDAFFTRKLKGGLRPIDADPRVVLSPADGRLESIARIDGRGTLVVKGRPYSVSDLVGGESEAGRLLGGTGLVIYLSPKDYHRVHAPVSGFIRRIRSMPGDYYPVNDVGVRHVANLLCRNRRVAIEIDADGGRGRVTVVMVAAMIVGRVTAIGVDARDVPMGDHHFDPPLRVERADEIGVFHLGSTAVLMLEPAAAGEWLIQQGAVRYGQALVRAPLASVQPGALR
ncbi:MAG: archaetidylserine decarboxylase [Polyangiaceae bacterium]|jgi:phosphatidylserine decarboxylase